MNAIADGEQATAARIPPKFQRNVLWYFAALAAAAVASFWPTYFAAPPFEGDFVPVHLHGTAMFGWFVLLLSQAALARAGRLRDHRLLGRVGYVLVPLIVASTLWLGQVRAHDAPGSQDVLWFLYVQLSLITFFTLCYAWAMTHRGMPSVHMRYIAGTAFAAVDPILARLLYHWAHIEPPLLQAITYGTVALAMGWLWWKDRERRVLAAAWRRMLVAYLLLVTPVFLVTQTAGWRSFVAWFGAL